MSAVDEALARLYPSRTWGEPDDAAALALRGGAATLAELPEVLASLADELASELRAATFVRFGGEDEPCDYVYVLCLGRAPCILQVRDHEVPVPQEWQPGETITEQYLRLCVSHRAPMAALQQVTLAAKLEGDSLVVRELPRAGVYDAPLLSRMQRAVAILPAYGLLHLDFGDIAGPPDGFSSGVWPELYAVKTGGVSAPAIANYLFFPQPATMVSTAYAEVARAGSSHSARAADVGRGALALGSGGGVRLRS